MKGLAAFFVFLCSLAYADLPSIEEIPVVREKILENLKEKNYQSADSLLKAYSVTKTGNHFFSGLERLQILISTKNYDEAITLWANALSLVHDYATPSIDNPLYSYCENSNLCKADDLRKHLNETVDIEDSSYRALVLDKIIKKSNSQETKDLAEIIATLERTECHVEKYGYNKNNPYKAKDNESYMVYSVVTADTSYIASAIKKSQAFLLNYPNSQSAVHVAKKKDMLEEALSEYRARPDPSTWKIYTGGFGVEAFYGPILGEHYDEWIVAIPLQVKRFILTPLIAVYDTGLIPGDESTKDEEFYIGFTFGYDVYDSRYIKVQPFVGFWNPIVAGAQLDYRFLATDGISRDIGAQPYLSLKIRYALEWFPGKGINHSLAIGLGAHFW